MSDFVASSATPGGTPLRVLLAEDNVTNQTLAVAILKKQGYSVAVAENGREALALYEREKFDLVLMDMQMPEMDGLEATVAIRSVERKTGSRIPIVAVTANAMLADRERCLSAGMDDYVSKPLRSGELLKAIQRVLTPKIIMDAHKNGIPAGSVEATVEIFDYHASVEQVEGDAELLGQLVTVFLGQLPTLLSAVASAVSAGDPAAVRKAAHALSSSVSVLAALRARNSAKKLEAMGLSGDLSEARQAHEQLVAEFDALLKVLNANPQLKAA